MPAKRSKEEQSSGVYRISPSPHRVYLTRSKRRRIEQEEKSSLPIPIHILQHCLSFLGPGNYFFHASVSKQFCKAMQQQYPNDFLTSGDSIISSPSRVELTFQFLSKLQTLERRSILKPIVMQSFVRDSTHVFDFLHKKEDIHDPSAINEIAIRAICKGCLNILKWAQECNWKFDHCSEQDLIDARRSAPMFCSVDMLQYLQDLGMEFSVESVYTAVSKKDISGQVLRFLLKAVSEEIEEDDSLINGVFLLAFQSGSLKTLKIIKDMQPPSEKTISDIFYLSVMRGSNEHIDVIKCFVDKESVSICDHETFTDMANFAASRGCVQVLKYLHEHVKEIDLFKVSTIAGRNSHEQAVRYCDEKLCERETADLIKNKLL